MSPADIAPCLYRDSTPKSHLLFPACAHRVNDNEFKPVGPELLSSCLFNQNQDCSSHAVISARTISAEEEDKATHCPWKQQHPKVACIIPQHYGCAADYESKREKKKNNQCEHYNTASSLTCLSLLVIAYLLESSFLWAHTFVKKSNKKNQQKATHTQKKKQPKNLKKEERKKRRKNSLFWTDKTSPAEKTKQKNPSFTVNHHCKL